MKRIFSCSAAPKIPLEKLTKNDRKLRSAVDNGDMVKLSSLLLKRTVVPTKLDPEGRSPFHLAASKGATGCLDLMLVYGVDLNAQDCEGCNALHLAVRNGRLGCVRSLLKYNVPVKETDFSGRTALHYAAMSGCISSAKLLCDHGASIDPFDREINSRRPQDNPGGTATRNLTSACKLQNPTGTDDQRQDGAATQGHG
ncbi:ankycorbin-like [Heptranchias perlo]|uniref:ankycorbin-like n=1 Tax=Heptranchias perlo TaxID=212740 RepID=UPI003559F688